MKVSRKIEEIEALEKAIGEKLYAVRKETGTSLKFLAALIGVTLQQFHKYEKGLNRISAGKLFYLAKEMKIPISSFFPKDDIDPADLTPDELCLIERFRKLRVNDQADQLIEILTTLKKAPPL